MKIDKLPSSSQKTASQALRFLTLALLCGALSLVAACNTVEGVGEDVQSAGKAVERTAK
jgi:predicted small secreted protein